MEILNLLRVRQWYKNLLVYLPIIFSGNLFSLKLLALTTTGFIALCIISSSQYIINDIKDAQKDRLHPEKRHRPIAAGRISKLSAIIISLILLAIGIGVSFKLSAAFALAATSLFLISMIYTFWLKNIAIADVMAISTNFVLRAASGAFLIDVRISPWLILGIFFLAWFLVTGKRHAEVMFLGKKAEKIRKTLTIYTKDLTYGLMIISTTALAMCYALYSFFSEHDGLLLTLPFALYTILRYFMHVLQGDDIARNPERAVTDKKLLLSAALWAAITFIIIYKETLLNTII
ncbi:MAG TPA: decaprenyl-phosphate phosphoribosyltransferase [Candidatus Woesearchaeota archaeon]|nr:MAG: decaprenyl-phosphate phosphoribosyltransferase [Candidatus Woesearchaeota archaeon]HDD70735.1 decaprenyl-phosphate phosphoribosyltransferase [Candidatus Woesearchaeota archaeon]